MSATTETPEKYPYPFPIIPRQKLWYTISAIVCLLGVGKMGFNYTQEHHLLDFGIDFTGGAAYVYKLGAMPGGNAADSIHAIRGTLDAAGVKRVKIQVFAGNLVQIETQTGADTNAAQNAADRVKAEETSIRGALTSKYQKVEWVQTEHVGPVIGEYLRQQAILAIIIGCALIMLYIFFRYNIGGMGGGFLFGVCAVAALIHDVLVMLAAYAWTGHEIDTTFIASVLTVIGYSMQDTVIIYDRIRENLRKLDAVQRRNQENLALVVEDSLWQTMWRSVMTVGCTLIPLTALWLFGGMSIRNFAFAMMVGFFTGGYSSIFFAPSLLLFLNKRAAAKASLNEAPVRVVTSVRPRPTATAPVAKPAVQLAPKAGAPTPSAAPSSAPASTAPQGGEDDEAKAAGKKKAAASRNKRRY